MFILWVALVYLGMTAIVTLGLVRFLGRRRSPEEERADREDEARYWASRRNRR
jgi:hypothetical protein